MLIKVVIRAINMDGGQADNMVVVPLDATVLEASRILSERNVGLGLVCDDDGRVMWCAASPTRGPGFWMQKSAAP